MKALTNSEIAIKLNITVESGKKIILFSNLLELTTKRGYKINAYGIEITENKNGKTSVDLKYKFNLNNEEIDAIMKYDAFNSFEKNKITAIL